MSFSDFNLKEDFIRSIEAAGYQSPTPLQSQLIPLVAEKKSALIWTQSASGKTGAFLIPAINYILENPAPEKRGARILILTSRRDRVSQINYTIKRLSSDHVMRFGFIVSGRPYQTQMRLMRRPLDIMIATPGRLNDLMNNGKADFSQLEMLIIDDLTSVYKKNLHGLVEKIIEQASDECSTLTFVRGDDELTPYAKSLFPDAVEISVDEDSTNKFVASKADVKEQGHIVSKSQDTKNKSTQEEVLQSDSSVKAADLMPQKVHIADDYTHKIAMMDHLMDEFAGESSMIYVATNKAAKILQENLSNHGHAAELIQDLSADEVNDCDIIIYSDQENPEVPIEQMTKNDKHIIHFDLPRRTDKYIERLMRHDQDREDGSLLMIDGYNYNELKHLEKTIGEKLDQINVPGLEPLKPFVNLSKSKPANKPNRNKSNQNKQGNHPKNSKPRQNSRARTNNKGQANKSSNNSNRSKNNATTRSNSNTNESTPDSKQRRQRKGAFGRLNGGANRKTANSTGRAGVASGRKSNNGGRSQSKVGVSSRGTGVPQGGRGWQSDFAAPKERVATESKNVVIRYSKKRTIVSDDKKNEDT